MDTFISEYPGLVTYTLSVIRHKTKDSKTEGILAILNGDTEQMPVYKAQVSGSIVSVWRKNRKILSPQQIVKREPVPGRQPSIRRTR
jgi:hypothetical protein